MPAAGGSQLLERSGGSGWAWIWRSLTITQPYPWSRSRATCFTLRHGALSRLGRTEIKATKEDVDYKRLITAGNCFACGDEVIDYGFVERFILSLQEKYGVEIVQVGYDRYNAISTVQKLEAAGIECVEVKQHSSVLHAPTKLLREKVLQRQFQYDETGFWK